MSLREENESQRLSEEVKGALNQEDYFPIESENGSLRVELDDVFVDWSKDPKEDNPGYITEARTENKSYEVPLRGNFSLYKDDEKVDEHTGKIGPYYPKVENLGTRIIDGRHYQDKFQILRNPGIYPFKKDGKPHVEFNSRQGGSFNLVVDQDDTDTPTFDIQVTGQNRKTIDRGAYTLMKMFDVPEEKIKETMGDAYKYNSKKRKVGQSEEEAEELDLRNDAARIYKSIAKQSSKNDEEQLDVENASFEEISKSVRDFLEEEKAFDKKVNNSTIGQESEYYGPDVIQKATEKLVQTYNGQHNPAHRFDEKFRSIHGLPTQISGNINRDSNLKGKFTQHVRNKIDQYTNKDPENLKVTDVLGSIKGNIKNKIQSSYTNSDLSTTTETNNILDIDHRDSEATIKGPGGIQSEHAIQPENVEVHPSRIGLTDVVNTQTSAPGVTVPIANGASIGEDGKIERRLFDRKEGEMRTVSGVEVAEGNVGFPDEFEIERDEDNTPVSMEPKSDEIMAGKGDDVETVNEEEVRYVLPQMSDMFSNSTNFVPFLNHNSGPRAIMGARQMAQAVSLEDPDTPIVDTIDSAGESFSEKVGRRFTPESNSSGTVKKIEDEAVRIENEDGEEEVHSLFNNIPLNRGGFINHEPVVEEGDEVEEGEILAKNNYTDEEGKMAIGKNLDTAYMPFKGFNFEDAMVMSEKGAGKLTSEHVYERVVELRDNDRQGLSAYESYISDSGNSLDPSSRAKLDQDGVIREGEEVEKGDILAAVVGVASLRNEPSKNKQLNSIFSSMDIDNRDRSIYWDKAVKGEVTKVRKGNDEIRVYVKSKEPMKEGDKISARDGGKGIISKIVPDDKMPRTEDGKIPDIMIDPHGVPSRANPGQIFELAAGKLADEKGEESFEIENFGSRTDWEDIKEELDKNDIDIREDMVDPVSGKEIPGVAMGKKHIGKLVHKLDKKFSARGVNEGYDMDRQPTGGASMDNLTVHSMIGHNARANLSEMTNLKGTKNNEYWDNLSRNKMPRRKAETPYSFKKFKGMMESLGVNIERDDNDALRVSPMTDEEVEDRSAGAIQESVRYETHSKPSGSRGQQGPDPFDKGLFDPNLVGRDAQNWNHIELPEPVPNPSFIKGTQMALKRGLRASLDKTPTLYKADGKERLTSDISQQDVRDIYTGDASIEVDGEEYSGGEDLKEVLSMVDPEKTEEVVREKAENYMGDGDFKEGTASDYKEALRYLGNLNDKGVSPDEAFMHEKVPVMPAEYRQPLITSDGEIHKQPVNQLYTALLDGSKGLRQAKEKIRSEDVIKDRRKGLLQDLGALYGGSGDKPRGNFKARSIMDTLSGKGAKAGTNYYRGGDDDGQGPKGGYIQKKVMKKNQEPSGSSTIVPSGFAKEDSKRFESTDGLGMDQVGMPEEMAWKTFEPFVREKLSKRMSPEKAAYEYKERTGRARQALEKEMEDRPVLLNRNPSWWPYNVTAHKPKLIEEDDDTEKTEKAIRIPNQVVAPYQGGDFDGDTMGVHVPVEREAKREAKDMLPSNNLRAPGSKKLMAIPDHSQLMGLHDLSLTSGDHPLAKGDEEVKNFQDVNNIKDLVRMYNQDEIPTHQKVEVENREGEKEAWTPGWAMVDDAIHTATDGKVGVNDVLKRMETDHPDASSSKESLDFDDDSMNDKFLESVMEHYPEDFADVSHNLAMAGAQHATDMGFSTGFDDIKPDDELAEKYYQKGKDIKDQLAQKFAEEDGREEPNEQDERKAMVNAYAGKKVELDGEETKGAIEAMEDEIESRPGENSMTRMMQVGSRGSSGQIRQLLGTVGLPKDVQKDYINEPIKNSLNRGLKGGEYFLEQHGTIKGLRDRAVNTRKPGHLGKQLIASGQHQVITEEDCGTNNGETLPLHDSDGNLNTDELNGRVPVNSQDPLTGAEMSEMERQEIEEVEVRSPLKCEAERGICKKCYGLKPDGEFPEMGDNVGVRSGQSLLEASTKLTLKSFHCLDRNMTVWIRDDDGKVRMPTVEQLWNEQSTEIHEVDGQKERKPDGDLEIWGKDGWTKAQTIMRHPQEEDTEMALTRTTEGAFIISQDNHPHMARDNKYVCPECGKALKCKPCETKMDNWYCRNGCVTKVDVSGDELYNEVEPQEMEDRTHRGEIIDKPEPSDAEPPVENGWLAGMFVAEGSVRHVKEHWEPTDTTNVHARSVQWSQSKQNKQLRSRLINAIEDEHGEVHLAGDDGKSITFDSTETAKLYDELFNRYSENKGAPDDFAGYSEEWLCDFVAGVLDGDGTIKETKGYKQINLDTTSPLLVQQMLVIGRMLNIPVRFRLTTNRELTRNQGYVLTIELVSEASKILRRTNRFSHLETKEDRHPERLHKDVIDYIRPVYTEGTPTVYDIETKEGTLAVNNMWTHNSTGEVDKTEPSFERLEEITQLKTPKWKAQIAEGEPGEKFEIEGINDVFAQDEKISTEIEYRNKEDGTKKTKSINVNHDLRDDLEEGKEVESGERFTKSGNYDPEELHQTRGIEDAQQYLTNELHSIFNQTGGLDRRSAEMAVRSMSDFGTVTDPGDSDWVPGQKVRTGKVLGFNKDKDDPEKKANIKPELHSMNKIPQLGENWLAKMNFEELKKHIQSSAIEGKKAEIHGTSPISSYMYGAEMDKGSEEWQY